MPVRTAISLHGHFDHAMVLPTFASEGLTIYFDDSNQYFLEQSLLQPLTLLTDALAKTKKKPKIVELPVAGQALSPCCRTPTGSRSTSRRS